MSPSHQTSSRYLCFSLGAEEYAVPLLSVREVIGVPDITPMPFSAPHFKGIMNLRGQVISVIDLRVKFQIKPKESTENSVIICDVGTGSLGVIVDSVNSVIHPSEEDVLEKPKVEQGKNSECITGVYRKKDQLILILDVDRTLTGEDRKQMAKSGPAA